MQLHAVSGESGTYQSHSLLPRRTPDILTGIRVYGMNTHLFSGERTKAVGIGTEKGLTDHWLPIPFSEIDEARCFELLQEVADPGARSSYHFAPTQCG